MYKEIKGENCIGLDFLDKYINFEEKIIFLKNLHVEKNTKQIEFIKNSSNILMGYYLNRILIYLNNAGVHYFLTLYPKYLDFFKGVWKIEN